MGPAVAITMLFTIAAALTLGPAILDRRQPFRDVRPTEQAPRRICIGGSGRAWCAGRCRSWSPAPPSSCSGRSSCRPTDRTTTTGSTSRADAPANLGFQAADRHFPKSKLFSEMLMIETDHDMRNSADFISLDRVARALDSPSRRRDGAKHHQAHGPSPGTRHHSLLVHHSRQRQRSTAPVQQAAKRQYRPAGTDPSGHRRGLAERDHLFPKGVR